MDSFILFLECAKGSDAVTVLCCSATATSEVTTVPFTSNDSQQLVQQTVDALQQHGQALSECEGIVVMQGAPRFTVARLVTVVANALSWSMHIPVAQTEIRPSYIKAQELLHTAEPFIHAQYSAEPTISR